MYSSAVDCIAQDNFAQRGVPWEDLGPSIDGVISAAEECTLVVLRSGETVESKMCQLVTSMLRVAQSHFGFRVTDASWTARI